MLPAQPLPDIMSVDEWKFFTELGLLKPRSSKLKAIDKAIEAYGKAKSKAGADLIRKLLDEWVAEKGGYNSAWMRESDGRNRLGAITVLRDQLSGRQVRMTRDDKLALAYIEEQYKLYVDNLFRGSLVDFAGKTTVIGMAMSAFSHAYSATSTAGRIATGTVQSSYAASSASASGQAGEIIKLVFGNPTDPETIARVQEHLHTSVQSLQSTLAVGIKIAPKAAKVVKSCYDVYSSLSRRCDGKAAERAQSVRGKEGEAALNAVIEMMTREAKVQATELAANTVQLGGAIGDIFTGGVTGAVTDIAAAVARLIRDMILLKLDLDEKAAANKYLTKLTGNLSVTPVMNFEVFGEAPLLGAYLILAADDSFLFRDLFTKGIGTVGFMQHIEYLKRRYNEPLMKATQTCIVNQRLRVTAKPIPKVHVIVDELPSDLLAIRDPGILNRMKMRWEKKQVKLMRRIASAF
ncbi:hypothetical protein [Paludibaculum fermentans]|uniref:Uncharacterized protein n=1 Tax=Paludibaculum fermentans TaxID=1473598 RepID=A0A7S7SKN4_PALFE|nr:hypothetical protein [Paludibaculum fermentans]QOY88524.1 hypothetical protein IRI77_00745 [Paludibaculum fermentans]